MYKVPVYLEAEQKTTEFSGAVQDSHVIQESSRNNLSILA